MDTIIEENKKLIEKYNNKIENDLNKIFIKTNNIKSKGIDGDTNITITKANSLIERVIGLISIKNEELNNQEIQSAIKKRIKELEKTYSKSDWRVAMEIALDFANNKFIKLKKRKDAIELGIRFGFGYITSGIVSSPIEGFIRLDIKKTKKNDEYFSLSFAGPIRNAGGTAASVCVLIADYIRQKLNYAKYDPSEDEINRTHTELTNYHERIANLQYFPSKQETLFFFKNIPIQIDGEPTNELEVFNFKNLPRIKTNRIRGGFCLVCSECLQLKAQKIEKIISEYKEDFKLKDWDFLKEYIQLQNKIKSENKNETNKKINNDNNKTTEPNFSYLKEISAGKPVFAYPMSPGFRLRYGRTRISGYSCVAMNPLSMKILNNFIATGSQIKTERPFKGATVTPCNTIEGPTILTTDNEIMKIDNNEKFDKIKNKIKKILHIGDILINFGDFLNRNHEIIPSGYVEEWWILDFINKLKEMDIIDKNISTNEFLNEQTKKQIESISNFLNIEYDIIKEIINNYLIFPIPFYLALKITKKLKIPLHPKFLIFITNLNIYEYNSLVKHLINSRIFFKDNSNEETEEDDYLNFYNSIESISIPNKEIFIEETEKKTTIKSIIEKLYLEHKFKDNQIIIEKTNARSFMLYFIQIKENEISDFVVCDIYKSSKNFKEKNNYAKEFSKLLFSNEQLLTENILKQINQKHKNNIIKKKNSVYIGLRLGRPEKSKPREIKNNPNGLFTLSDNSKNLLDMSRKNERILSQKYICNECNNSTTLPYCIKCNKILQNEKFNLPWKNEELDFGYWEFNSKEFFEIFNKKYNITAEDLEKTKPIQNLNNNKKFTENYLKGILRNKYNLNVNKDGTIRYDATESPMTHFKPKEINLSIEKLKKLGYKYDINNKEITSDLQVIELFPQDVILPNFSDYNNISAIDFFYNTTKFIDELLKKLYNSNSYYNLKSKEEIIGQYLIAIAPHTSAGIVTRIIGYTNTQCLFAHPLLHANLRRDCDGDEAGLALLLDGLLNFSTRYISTSRGATMDRPLVLSSNMIPDEVDDMAFDIDIERIYDLNFYLNSQNYNSPKDDLKYIKTMKKVIENKYKYNITKFTHNVDNLNYANNISAYKYLPTMFEKVKSEVELMQKLIGVKDKNAIELMINKFFVKDMKGNIKKFSQQSLRCAKCNHIMRRPPLNGKCPNCKEQNLIFTIAPNSIIKYTEIIKFLDKNIDKTYTHETLEYLFTRLNTIIKQDETTQIELF